MEELRISNTTFEAIKLNKSNLSRSCRLCLTENNVQPLFKLCFDGLLMSDIFKELTSLQIKANDNLPQRICIKCIEKLITSYEFIRKCQKIDEILHAFLDEKQEQEEIIINETTTDDCKTGNRSVFQCFTPQESLTENHKIIEDATGNCKNPEVMNLNENSIENSQDELTEELDNTLVKCEILTEEYDNNEEQVETNNVIIELCQEVEENYLDRNKVEESTSGSRTKFENVDLNSPELLEPSSFKCSICDNCYDSLEDLNKHRRNSYKCKPFKCCCKICGKKFKTNWKLKVHERVHTDEKPYECDVCNKGFNVIQNLDRHKRIHTGEKPFLCEICGKRFTRLLTKNEHMRIHSGEKPYNCKICKVDFYRLGEFKIHMRSHECNDNTLKCPHCCKIYVTPKMFHLHIKSHQSLNKPKQARAGSNKCLLCSLCGKTFATTGNLKIHLSMHSGSMQYACEICNKKFCYKSSLVKHALIHTGERPYCCTYCKKAFVQSVHLRQHLRVHTGEKPYTCDVCGKSFALSCNLIVHKRMHTGETPYKCAFCDKGFYDSSSMKKHEKVHRFVKTE